MWLLDRSRARINGALYSAIRSMGGDLPNLVAANAVVAKTASLGCGNFVGLSAVINATLRLAIIAYQHPRFWSTVLLLVITVTLPQAPLFLVMPLSALLVRAP